MPAAEGPDPRAAVAGTRRWYDLVAGDYAAAISGELAGKPFDRALLDALVELAAGFAIADVGCGPGHVTGYLADRGGRVVLGLDLSTAMAGIDRVDLTFRFLDPDEETRALAAAGLEVTARLDREPLPTGEHASRRSYLVLRRAVGG